MDYFASHNRLFQYLQIFKYIFLQENILFLRMNFYDTEEFELSNKSAFVKFFAVQSNNSNPRNFIGLKKVCFNSLYSFSLFARIIY